MLSAGAPRISLHLLGMGISLGGEKGDKQGRGKICRLESGQERYTEFDFMSIRILNQQSI